RQHLAEFDKCAAELFKRSAKTMSGREQTPMKTLKAAASKANKVETMRNSVAAEHKSDSRGTSDIEIEARCTRVRAIALAANIPLQVLKLQRRLELHAV